MQESELPGSHKAPPAAPGAVPPAAPPPAYPYAGYPPAAPPPYWPGVRRASFSGMFTGTFDVWTKNFGPFFVVYLVLALVTGGLSLAGAYLILGVPFVISSFLPGSVPMTASITAYIAYEVVVGVITWVLTSAVLGASRTLRSAATAGRTPVSWTPCPVVFSGS